MRTPSFSLALLLTTGALLTACGQKGPLYLPQQPASPATSPAPADASTTAAGEHTHSAPVTAQDEEKKDTTRNQQTDSPTEAEAVSK